VISGSIEECIINNTDNMSQRKQLLKTLPHQYYPKESIAGQQQQNLFLPEQYCGGGL
jgi:hypothetical protein